MRPLAILPALALLVAMTVAEAHAHLRSAVPADGSSVATPPSRVVLRFSEAARLTAAWIARNAAPREPLRPLPDRAARELALSLPTLAPGRYVVSWRALSADGHIMPGEVRFTVLARGMIGHAPEHATGDATGHAPGPSSP